MDNTVNRATNGGVVIVASSLSELIAEIVASRD